MKDEERDQKQSANPTELTIICPEMMAGASLGGPPYLRARFAVGEKMPCLQPSLDDDDGEDGEDEGASQDNCVAQVSQPFRDIEGPWPLSQIRCRTPAQRSGTTNAAPRVTGTGQ